MSSSVAQVLFIFLLASVSTQARERGSLPTYTDRPTYPHTVSFQEVHDEVDSLSAMHTTTYRSMAMPLAPGEVVFTDPQSTILKFPEGKISIAGFYAEVVDENNASVPLSEAYLHHWLVFGPPNKGVCGGYLDYSFGVGAESRGTPVSFPDPYVLFADDSDVWGANIHILRTVDLDPKWGVQNCIECMYAPGKGCDPDQTGQFACCLDGSMCPTKSGAPTTKKNYYLQYKVTWSPVQSHHIPVDLYVLDASRCQIEYNIYKNPSNVVTTTLSYPALTDGGSVVFSVGHVHIAGYNITLYTTPSGSTTRKAICTNVPKYGTELGVAGNEKGYVVAIPPCKFDAPVPLQKGDVLTLESVYSVAPSDPRTFSKGWHGGVMSLYYLAVVPKS